HDEGAPTRRRIERLLAIEELGGEVLALSADVADPVAMQEAAAAAGRRFGAVHAVIHAAGVPGGGLLQGKGRETAELILAPKVRGALVLSEIFTGAELDFFVLASSITVLLPEVGQTDYVAANAFLDSFAALRARGGEAAVAINWDAWRETGMAVATAVREEWKARRQESLAQGLASREGVEAFRRIVGAGLPQVVVSTLDLAGRRAANARPGPRRPRGQEPAPGPAGGRARSGRAGDGGASAPGARHPLHAAADRPRAEHRGGLGRGPWGRGGGGREPGGGAGGSARQLLRARRQLARRPASGAAAARAAGGRPFGGEAPPKPARGGGGPHDRRTTGL